METKINCIYKATKTNFMPTQNQLSKIVIFVIVFLNVFALYEAFKYKSITAVLMAICSLLLLLSSIKLFNKLKQLESMNDEEMV